MVPSCKMGMIKAPTDRAEVEIRGVNVFKVLKIEAGVHDMLSKYQPLIFQIYPSWDLLMNIYIEPPQLAPGWSEGGYQI